MLDCLSSLGSCCPPRAPESQKPGPDDGIAAGSADMASTAAASGAAAGDQEAAVAGAERSQHVRQPPVALTVPTQMPITREPLVPPSFLRKTVRTPGSKSATALARLFHILLPLAATKRKQPLLTF